MSKYMCSRLSETVIKTKYLIYEHRTKGSMHLNKNTVKLVY